MHYEKLIKMKSKTSKSLRLSLGLKNRRVIIQQLHVIHMLNPKLLFYPCQKDDMKEFIVLLLKSFAVIRFVYLFIKTDWFYFDSFLIQDFSMCCNVVFHLYVVYYLFSQQEAEYLWLFKIESTRYCVCCRITVEVEKYCLK